MESSGAYVTGPVFFGPPSRALVVITWKEGMPLHDTVGINCEKGATTENQSTIVEYMG